MMEEEIDYANVQDKIDWRIVIMRTLQHAHWVDEKTGSGLVNFMNAVAKAVDVIGIAYPGWDAREDVDSFVKKAKKKYQYKKAVWSLRNPTANRVKKFYFLRDLHYNFHKEILHFLDDYVGQRRMLLFGKPDSRGLGYKEV